MRPRFIRGSSLFQTFSKSLDRFPIDPKDKIVLAVSGGPDSVCLLYLFKKYLEPISSHQEIDKKKCAVGRLHVAHLNHSFRPEADEEAAFVADLCRSWGISSTITKRPVPEICRERRLSKQEGARLVRYDFLMEVAQTEHAQWIALGHTADDHVETFLMNLLRGTGGDGLTGIPKMREGKIIRPLLHAAHNDILLLLREENIPFREDSSNQDKRYLRNRIRHDLIPILKTYNPNIKRTVLRTSSVLTEEADFFNNHITSLIPERTLRITGNEVVFDIALFCALHKAIQRRLIRQGIQRLHGNLRGIGFDHIEAILKIAYGAGEKSFLLPDLSVKKTGATLVLGGIGQSGQPFSTDRGKKRADIPVEETVIASDHDFFLPTANFLGGLEDRASASLRQWGIRLFWSLQNRSETPFSPKKDDCSAFFDFDTIGYPLTVRGWRRGDRFMPLGMRGRHKKLQDFFVDQKIPMSLRNQIPILDCPKGIIWVIGVRPDERFKVTEETKRILSLYIEKGGATPART